MVSLLAVYSDRETIVDAFPVVIAIRENFKALRSPSHAFGEYWLRGKGSLAPLAAVAPLTRPARPPVVGNCRTDVCGSGFLARRPHPVSKWSDASSAWEHQ
jgi:hypothetical protein